MEKCKVIGYVVAAGLCLAGCKPGPTEGVRNDIQFDSTLVSQQYHLLGNEQYPNCNLQIKFVYPDGAEASVLPKLQKQFVAGYFGEAYGLRIRSALGVGTCVEVRLPKLEYGGDQIDFGFNRR